MAWLTSYGYFVSDLFYFVMLRATSISKMLSKHLTDKYTSGVIRIQMINLQ